MAVVDATLNSWTTLLFNNTNVTVNAPPTPNEGHWFGIKAVSPGGTGFGITVVGNGNKIESVRGDGLNATQTAFFAPYRFFRWNYFNDGTELAWWLTSPPIRVGESWEYVGPGNLPLNTSAYTTIPLTYSPFVSEPNEFFQSNGAGGLTCIERFAGTIEGTHYLEYISTGNNQELNIHLQWTPVVGTPTILQGQGFRDSFFTARSGGNFLKSLSLEYGLIIDPGEQIRFEGILDPFTTMQGYIVPNTDLLFKIA